VKLPLALMLRSSPPLLRRTSPVPFRPVTVPPTEKLLVTQLTARLTGPPATVPAGAVTEQVCHGLVGCDRTVTA
jgi:hypothetical protein